MLRAGRFANSGPEISKPIGGVIGDCARPACRRLSTVERINCYAYRLEVGRRWYHLVIALTMALSRRGSFA